MADYIDKNDLREYISGYIKSCNGKPTYTDIDAMVGIISLLEQMPAADVQPVKRGKMIAMSDEEKYRAYKDTARDYDGRCSLCNCCVYDTDIFCAECGAILQDAETTKG